jgi:cysteinyl-tRNA synthetase
MKMATCLLWLVLTGLAAQAQPRPDSFAYVLQADSLAKSKAAAVGKLAKCHGDWIVIDASYSDEERWSADDVAAIRAGKPGRKVIAYLSIGEAENYRSYWRKDWATNAPAFLLDENPEWKGDFRVKYWQPAWQQLILPEVDKVMAAGFDGVYLDIVDGFETFERNGTDFIDDRVNPETKQTYRQDMIIWVKAIAARAHKTNPSALVIPQNGSQLLAHADFLAVVDAMGVEDLFTDDNKIQKADDSDDIVDNLAPLVAAHKPVLDIEYARAEEPRQWARLQAAKNSFVWLLTDTDLKTLGQSGR